MNKGIFKAYDIRGIYPNEINEEVVSEISQVLRKKLFQEGKIIIARDARLSSPKLYEAVLQGLEGSAYDVGMATTPMFYFLVNKLNAAGGIMITASHNPKEYNGLKIVGKNAEMVGGEEILKLMTND